MMQHSNLAFYVGLAREKQEIDGVGYVRQRVTLTRRMIGDYANATVCNFGPPLSSWGFIDAMVLSSSHDGPIIAITPLLIPIFVKAGDSFSFPPDSVLMNQRSIDAIVNRRPILIRHPAMAS